MVAFGHSAVGVIVGTTAYNFFGQGNLATGLILAGAAGVISHYITDFIPHGHFTTLKNYKKGIIPIIIFDLLLSVLIFLGLYLKDGLNLKFFYVLFGIGGSHLPDVLDGLIHIGLVKAKGALKIENNFHQMIHWHARNQKALLLGLKDIWQLTVVLAALLLLFFK